MKYSYQTLLLKVTGRRIMIWGTKDCFDSTPHRFMGVSHCWIHSKMHLDAPHFLYLCVLAFWKYSKPTGKSTTTTILCTLLLLKYQYCYCFVLIPTLQFHTQFLHGNMQTKLRLNHQWYSLQRQMQLIIVSVGLIAAEWKNYIFSLITSKFLTKRESFKGIRLMEHFSGIHSVRLRWSKQLLGKKN